jgi:hypothetical protein
VPACQALDAEGSGAEDPAGIGNEKEGIGQDQRNVSDDRFTVGDNEFGTVRRDDPQADQFFPDALAFKQAVTDEQVSRGRQKSDHIRQSRKPDDDEEVDKTCNGPGCEICLLHTAS